MILKSKPKLWACDFLSFFFFFIINMSPFISLLFRYFPSTFALIVSIEYRLIESLSQHYCKRYKQTCRYEGQHSSSEDSLMHQPNSLQYEHHFPPNSFVRYNFVSAHFRNFKSHHSGLVELVLTFEQVLRET